MRKYLETTLGVAIVVAYLLVYREAFGVILDNIFIVGTLAFGATVFLEKAAGVDEVEVYEEEDEEVAVRSPMPLTPDVVCPECFGAGYRIAVVQNELQERTCSTCQGRRTVPPTEAEAYQRSNPDR